MQKKPHKTSEFRKGNNEILPLAKWNEEVSSFLRVATKNKMLSWQRFSCQLGIERRSLTGRGSVQPMVLTSRYAVCRSSMASKWIFNDRMNTLAVRIPQSIRICVHGGITINRYIIYTPLVEIKMGILPTLQSISFDLSYGNLVVNGRRCRRLVFDYWYFIQLCTR